MVLTSTQKNKAWCESYILMEEHWEAMRAADKVTRNGKPGILR
jgi:hypothetical protein